MAACLRMGGKPVESAVPYVQMSASILARVGRTLLSAAFDFDFEEYARDFETSEMNRWDTNKSIGVQRKP